MLSRMITNEEIKSTAQIARLALKDEEITQIAHQLERVLGYIEQLKQVDVEGVEPTFYMGEKHGRLRKDIVGDHLSTDEVLLNAPQKEASYFVVPPIIETAS